MNLRPRSSTPSKERGKPSAPPKKTPSPSGTSKCPTAVHNPKACSVPTFLPQPSTFPVDDESYKTELVKEKQKNKELQLEVDRLKKSLDITLRKVQVMSNELDDKNKLINHLMEDGKTCASEEMKKDETSTIVETLDIDSLLQANLGSADLNKIMEITESSPMLSKDIADIYFPGAEGESVSERELQTFGETTAEAELTVAPTIAQKESSCSEQSVVKQLADQRGKVPPIKIIKGKNQYRLEKKATKIDEKPRDEVVTTFRKDNSAVKSSCLTCPQCGKQFPLGGQWKLRKHLQMVHEVGGHFCHVCDKEFDHQSLLLAHSNWHRRQEPWMCKHCKQVFGGLELFVDHVRFDHGIPGADDALRLLVHNNPT